MSIPTLSYSDLRLQWQVEGEGWRLPPFLATAVRGALGASLRAISCTTDAPTCDDCDRLRRCVYGRVWEGAHDVQIGGLGGLRANLADPPSAYAILAPWSDTPHQFSPGSRLEVRVRLFGTARGYAPSLVTAATRCAPWIGDDGGRAPMTLAYAGWVDPTAPQALRPLTDPPTPVRVGGETGAGGRLVSLSLQTVSPVWLRANKRDVLVPDLRTIVSALATRLEVLSRTVEADVVPSWRVQDLLDEAAAARVVRQNWEEAAFSRRSRRQPGSPLLPVPGVLGEAVYEGVTPRVAALLGTLPHVLVGRNAMLGLGRFEVRRIA